MQALGIRPAQVVTIVREARALSALPTHVSVDGPGAEEVAAALAEGGDRSAVLVGSDPALAAVAVRLVDGPVSATEHQALRRLTRLSKPIIVLRRGGAHVPYALPGNVIDAEGELPLQELAAAIARAAPDASPGLASRLPVLRPAVERRLIRATAWGNAVIAASPGTDGGHLPLLSIAQGRMLLLMGASRGETLPQDPQAVAKAVAPPIAGSIAVGAAARQLVRRLPVQGPLVRGAVAFAITRAIGEARLRLP